jgi:hypothetical protein
MKWSLVMTQSTNLPSALKVAAEIDAALAQAGLAGPQVEREAIPMFLSMLHELIDGPETNVQLSELNKSNVAEIIVLWVIKNQVPVGSLVNTLTEQVNEVIELSRVHGTLQDFKRRELLNLHRTIVDSLQRQSVLQVKPQTKSS